MAVERGSVRVLIVQDDRFLRRVHEVGLRQRGFAVLTAADGEEGLRVARAERPDVVLLDLVMPKLQGFEVLRLLKADPATHGIAVVVLSSLGGDGDVETVLKAGAASHLLKGNLTTDTLAATVDGVLKTRSSVTGQ